MTRRSVSSCVSPGPRVPMPPPVRERCVHMRVRRGSWYSSWASSTWSRPSCVRACWAKMSRIRPLRSSTLTASRLSSAFCCLGLSSSSAMSSVKPVSRLALTSSWALPLPTYQLGSTWRRFCHSAPTTSAPAVSARLASSVDESSAVQPSPCRCRRRRGRRARAAPRARPAACARSRAQHTWACLRDGSVAHSAHGHARTADRRWSARDSP